MKTELNPLFAEHAMVLDRFGVSAENILKLQEMWNEPHRRYHNQEHLEEILGLAKKAFIAQHPLMVGDSELKPSGPLRIRDFQEAHHVLVVAAIFHDAIYNPVSKTNEEDSAALIDKFCNPDLYPEDRDDELGIRARLKKWKDVIVKMILDTKDHTKTPSSALSDLFLTFDLHGLTNGTLSRMIADEKKIFQEFGFVDYSLYKMVRGSILEGFVPHILKRNPESKIAEYVDWFNNREIKIAVFAGTFLPWHKGHENILQKAEKIFDKVILASGPNPAKPNQRAEQLKYLPFMQKAMPNHQIELFDGMLTEYVKSKGAVSVVKGLRNPVDFESEKMQLRYMEDLDPSINVTYIISDREYEHVSSSGIKMVRAIDPKASSLKNYLVFESE